VKRKYRKRKPKNEDDISRTKQRKTSSSSRSLLLPPPPAQNPGESALLSPFRAGDDDEGEELMIDEKMAFA
jgi:hypothetical protein